MTSGPTPVVPDRNLFDECSEIADQLDEVERRLARPAGEFGHADALRLDHIALRLDDLRTQHRWSGRHDASSTTPAGLAALYTSPLGDVGSMVDALIDRAALLREQAWLRVGVPLPHSSDATDAIAASGASLELLPAPEAPIAGSRSRAVAVGQRSVDPWKVATEVLTAIGVLVLLFVLHVVYASGLFAARSQRDLSREFESMLRTEVARVDAAANADVQESSIEVEEPDPTEAPERSAFPASGEPVAILSMPTVGARDVVVEGTTAERLVAGPGHLRSTPMPGRAGNAVLFGRRTTYGGPFKRVDDLRPGDPIEVVTLDGLFRYIVQSVDRVRAGQPDPIGPTNSNRLTLISADERFSAGGRLVVVAMLDGAPMPSPTTADGQPIPLPTTGAADLGTQRAGTDWALLLVWTQVLVITYLGARWLYRHWLPWSTWLVSAPIVLVVAFAWLDSIARMLPSTV